MPQLIIKSASPTPSSDAEDDVASPSPQPLADSKNHSFPAPRKEKTSHYTPSSPTPIETSPPSSPSPTTTTEDTLSALEEHDTPLLPLEAEVDNESGARNTGAFILLWVVGIVLAPLACAMAFAAWCIVMEWRWEAWWEVLPFGRGIKELGEAAMEELVSEVTEGHIGL